MSDDTPAEKADHFPSEEEEDEEDEGEKTPHDYGEGGAIPTDIKPVPDFAGEAEDKEWVGVGEYGEGGLYYILRPAGEDEYPSIWGEKESSVISAVIESEVEETEEEKELRKERELLIEEVRQKILGRILLRRRNAFLQKKLAEHFKKRRMENVFKEEPKGLDLDKKYLRRLYAFQDFKQAQEKEIDELTTSLERFEQETKDLELELGEKLLNFVSKAKEVSLNLILSKSGKKLSEKAVDRLLKRLLRKNEEKGKKKLKYIKIKNLIEEKGRQLKALEYLGEGLYTADYEQLKIDNLNFSDKIEEKEDELTKMRIKTENIMLNLSQIREKTYAIEGDIELMAEKVYEVESKFAETRKRLTEARKKRDSVRYEVLRLKMSSGLLINDNLLKDFESSIYEAKNLTKELGRIKKLMQEKKKQEFELSKKVLSTSSEFYFIKDLNKLTY